MKEKFQSLFVKRFEGFRVVSAILLGYMFALVIISFISSNPLEVIRQFVLGPFLNMRRFSNVLSFMIPLMFTGLGMSMMLRVGEFNLTVDGAFYLTGSITAFLSTKILTSLPGGFAPVVLIAIAALIGAIITSIPAYIKLKTGSNEVVLSIMMNFILILFGRYLLLHHMSDASVTYNASYPIPDSYKLSTIIPGTEVHSGIFIAFIAIIIFYILMSRTNKGYEINLTGSNPKFANYIGINVTLTMLLSQALGGALGGAGGAIEILGKYNRFIWMDTLEYGMDGVLIAVIAKNQPLLVIPSAFFLAYIRAGSDIVGTVTDIPVEFISVVQGIIIILVAAEHFLTKYRDKMITDKSLAAEVRE